MDLATVADAFVVTVVGGWVDSRRVSGGAVDRFAKALCIALGTDPSLISPSTSEAHARREFVVMAIVLALRPQGLLGHAAGDVTTTPLPEHRAIVVAPTRRDRWIAVAIFVAFALLPFINDDYALVLAIDVLIATLFAASLQFLSGTGGMTSFGHAAYFGVGSLRCCARDQHGVPFAGALALGHWLRSSPRSRSAGSACASRRLPRDADACFAQIIWSIAFQWDSVTGGSNGIVGVWPGEWFADRRSFFALTLVTVGVACAAIVAIADGPFGHALRGARDSTLRAAAIASMFGSANGRASSLPADSPDSPARCSLFRKAAFRRRRSPFALDRRAGDGPARRLERALRTADRRAAFTWLQDTLARVTSFGARSSAPESSSSCLSFRRA